MTQEQSKTAGLQPGGEEKEHVESEFFITNDEKKHEISLFVPGINDEIVLNEKEVRFLSTILPNQIQKWK